MTCEQTIEVILRFFKHDDEEDARLRMLMSDLNAEVLVGILDGTSEISLTGASCTEVMTWVEANCIAVRSGVSNNFLAPSDPSQAFRRMASRAISAAARHGLLDESNPFVAWRLEEEFLRFFDDMHLAARKSGWTPGGSEK